MWAGFRASVSAIVATAGLAMALPAGAAATQVGLSAVATEPGKCFPPKGGAYASTSCQIFLGESLDVVALATRDDGSVRLEAQPFTLLELRKGGPVAVASFTYFDENDVDDQPTIAPSRSTDYELRFEGNKDMPAGTSATMAVQVGARLTIPPDSESGTGTALRIPARVVLPSRSLRGRVELRRCHRYKAHSAVSCARARDYTVLARRAATRTRQVTFPIAAPPRSLRRYEIVFRPRSKAFAVTRQAFTVLNGFDGITTYRPTVRSSPFGNR